MAIVGTRSPSEAGRALAGRLAASAVESGYTVFAGLAEAIRRSGACVSQFLPGTGGTR